MSSCKDCEKDVVWAEKYNGRSAPFDAKPVKDSTFRLFVIVKGRAELATANDIKLHRELHTCHYDTCPDRRK